MTKDRLNKMTWGDWAQLKQSIEHHYWINHRNDDDKFIRLAELERKLDKLNFEEMEKEFINSGATRIK